MRAGFFVSFNLIIIECSFELYYLKLNIYDNEKKEMR